MEIELHINNNGLLYSKTLKYELHISELFMDSVLILPLKLPKMKLVVRIIIVII